MTTATMDAQPNGFKLTPGEYDGRIAALLAPTTGALACLKAAASLDADEMTRGEREEAGWLRYHAETVLAEVLAELHGLAGCKELAK
jgi:hypothetical protein